MGGRLLAGPVSGINALRLGIFHGVRAGNPLGNVGWSHTVAGQRARMSRTSSLKALAPLRQRARITMPGLSPGRPSNSAGVSHVPQQRDRSSFLNVGM